MLPSQCAVLPHYPVRCCLYGGINTDIEALEGLEIGSGNELAALSTNLVAVLIGKGIRRLRKVRLSQRVWASRLTPSEVILLTTKWQLLYRDAASEPSHGALPPCTAFLRQSRPAICSLSGGRSTEKDFVFAHLERV